MTTMANAYPTCFSSFFLIVNVVQFLLPTVGIGLHVVKVLVHYLGGAASLCTFLHVCVF